MSNSGGDPFNNCRYFIRKDEEGFQQQQPSTSNSSSTYSRPLLSTTTTTIPPQLVTRASTNGQPIIVQQQRGTLVVGEKVLIPAGVMHLQPSTSDGLPKQANGTWQPKPSVRMIAGSFSASPAMMIAQPRHQINYDGTRRTVPKVVQAIPFMTSSSNPPTLTINHPQTNMLSGTTHTHHTQQHAQLQTTTSPQSQATWYITSTPTRQQLTMTTLPNNNNHHHNNNSHHHHSNTNHTNIQTTTSSATPDSGIQSVPTSPPSPSFGQTSVSNMEGSVCEDKDEDFADMPILIPADQEEEMIEYMPSTSSASNLNSLTKEDGASHGSECETAPAPSISISPSMDSDEIVNRLIALDPLKATAIAMLIKKKTQINMEEDEDEKERKEEKEKEKEEEIEKEKKEKSRRNRNEEKEMMEPSTSQPSNHNISKRAKQRSRQQQQKMVETVASTNTDQEEPSMIDDISKTDEASPKDSKKRECSIKGKRKVEKEKEIERIEEIKRRKKPKIDDQLDNTDAELKYRLGVWKDIQEAVDRAIDMTCIELGSCRLGENTIGSKNMKKMNKLRNPWKCEERNGRSISPSSSKLKIKKVSTKGGKVEKEKKDVKGSRFSTRRMTNRNDESPENEQIEGRFNGEYEEIPKSIASGEHIYSLWKAPTLQCGCTKGACTSDVECLNRALRVQCSSECSLTLCANKKFWRDETSKLCVSNGPKSKRCLKSRISRRAGELLCEYAGEIVTSYEAIQRNQTMNDPRLLAITSSLFIDATSKGNVGRFVKHSCKPNSRLEVWSINGYYRAGIFTLYDIASNCEITIDKNGLVPEDVPCNCGVSECREIIRASKYCQITSGATEIGMQSEQKHRRFLARNKRNTIECIKRSSGLKESLLKQGNNSTECGMRKVFDALSYRIRNIDGSMPMKYYKNYSDIRNYLKRSDLNINEFGRLIRKWLDLVDDDDIDRAYIAIQNKWLSNDNKGDGSNIITTPVKKSNISRQRAFSTNSSSNPFSNSTTNGSSIGCQTPIRSKDTDLSYLESLNPIGSYDPDDAWCSYRANADDNAVRCVCGSLDEDGEMIQCDHCHFWLHIDCVMPYNETDEYQCDFCNGTISNGRPCQDVQLQSQPDVRFQQCTYYKALVNRRGIQVRLNETVYVNKQLPEEHKVLLRNLREENTKKKGSKDEKRVKSKYEFPIAPTTKLKTMNVDRKDTRIFRVERLFTTPGNNRFVFGSFCAWPHETYVDTQRMFSQKEVFPTPLYETLPLDEVIGRCMVIDVETWCKGRPKVPKFKEEDVFLCEWQLGKNQRCFERVLSKNQYPINTQSYVFEEFSKKMKVVRDFRPYDRMSSSTPSKNSSSKCSPISREEKKNKAKSTLLAQQNLQQILDRLSKNKK